MEKDRLETRLECSQSELGKSKAELDKAASEVGHRGADWEAAKQRLARLEMENDRLRHDLERSQTTFGRSTLSTSAELDRHIERADKASTELRRAQVSARRLPQQKHVTRWENAWSL